MSLISVGLTLFKYPGLWEKFDSRLGINLVKEISFLYLLANLDMLIWKTYDKSS